MLEEKGAKVGLLVTENFEQVLHLARSQTPGPLAGWIIMQKPDPLADLELTRGIRQRMNSRGDVVTPLDEASARKAVRELIDLGAEAITVSLMHSYANPEHEKRIKAIVEEMAPEMTVSLLSFGNSARIPRIRAYAGHGNERVRAPEHEVPTRTASRKSCTASSSNPVLISCAPTAAS